ncbi:MAG: hypothetical protein ISR58_01580 [Anaerolineales bacterium]|nr:hypothetical protein [Chloroflexota bacterium]MBL6979856.1 hypothetical protein [Anaerolineales bacterium]
MNSLKKNWLIVSLLIVYFIYAGLYIYQTSFISDGTRYFVLFDDAMISMRYAKNFADGYGLVWNPGETPVEGYTNPLWVMFMAFFHLFPLPTEKISLAIQISGAIFLGANLILVKKITNLISSSFLLPLFAILLTAFYTPLNNWGLQGMEVSILVLLLSVAVWKLLVDFNDDKFSPWPYLLLGFGTFVRVDMAVAYLVLIGFSVVFIPKYRWRHLLWGVGLLVAFLASQTLFRIWYYGDPLPNTYYLKMSGIPLLTRVKRGLYVLYQFVWEMNWVLLALPFAYLVFKRDRKTILLALLVLGQLAYSVYVGGDAWEHKGGANRYIALAMPMFFILFVYSIDQILQAIKSSSAIPNTPISTQTMVNMALVTAILASLINFNFIQKDIRYLERWLLLRPPIFIEGNKEAVRIASAVRKVTTSDAEIGVVTAGAIPYFADRLSLDLLGKNDAYIAHLPSHIASSLDDIRPGHMKWDYDYSIGQLKPDMILQLWGDKTIAYDYIEQYYTVIEVDGMLFSARSDSPYILWDRVDSTP